MRNPDQNQLHQLEALCVQEQPPACMSGCPLHVDGRSLCAAAAADDFDSALDFYRKIVPFPEILSRTCSQNCRQFCRRAEAGDAVMMRGLEEAACRFGKPKQKRTFLPKRNHSAAVVGAGLSGLTAALEMAKKGCRVTVFEKEAEIGGKLRSMNLEADVLERDFRTLKDYPITIRCGEKIEDLQEITRQFDVVYVAWGVQDAEVLKSQPDSYQSADEKIFVGGYGIRRQQYDTAWEIADGKRAAISMDRFLKQVSIMAGREKEDVYQTSLHVNMEGIESVCAQKEPPYTREEAVQEAKRCLDCKCLDCVKACVFLQEYKTFPRKYVREVYNNLSIAMGNHHTNRVINSCALCGQCAAICPHGLDVGEYTKEARQIMVKNEKMPVSSFEFGLRDLEHANSQELSVLRHQPGTAESRYLFFPGCQIGASAPEIVYRTYEDLCGRLPGGVGLYLGCCGIVADWAGEEDLFEKNIEIMRENWESMGSPVVITACPTCYRVWKEQIPQAKVEGIWSLLDTWPEFASAVEVHSCSEKKTVTVMDACGARQYGEIHEQIRHLLEQMGYELEGHAYEGGQSGCCGFGGLMPVSNRELAKKMAASRVEEKDRYYLTYCMNCRDRYTDAGAVSVHLLELFYGEEKAQEHLPPTWSDRQRRRRWLKRKLMQELWQEKMEGRKEMKLYYSDEIKEQMEERMILEEDMQDVIEQAEASQEKIQDTVENCYIAVRRIGNVCFWVYYRPKEDGYEVVKAYSHRMNFK